MRFIPMDFCTCDCTIGQPDSGNTLHLAPSAGPVDFSQAAQFADAAADRDCTRLGDFTKDLERHANSLLEEVAIGYVTECLI